MALVYLGLGSNLGDRPANIAAAVSGLGAVPGARVLRVSGNYETRPVGGPAGQPDFMNAACAVETGLEPLPFLDAIHDVERMAGRRREEEGVRWGPRFLDIDILLWDGLVFDVERLTVPHPRLAEREFALRPLAEIAPDAIHPVFGLSVRELLARVAG